MDSHCSRATLRQTRLFNTKTLITRPKTFFLPCSLSTHPRPHFHPHRLRLSNNNNSTKHTNPLAENFNDNKSLAALIKKLSDEASCPLQILRDDGDWSKKHFWAVIRFLQRASRSAQILQVPFLPSHLSFCTFFVHTVIKRDKKKSMDSGVFRIC